VTDQTKIAARISLRKIGQELSRVERLCYEDTNVVILLRQVMKVVTKCERLLS